MEFCNHGSLDGLLQRAGKLPLRTAAPLMIHWLAGLAYAHTHKFVHRDLKPQNILLHQQEGQVRAKLTDFGLAKSFETAGLSGMTATGSAGGTFFFMPREQLTNFKYVHPVSDVWSMAATFYKALTGKYPLNFAKNRDPMEVILRDEAVPIRQREPDLPQPLAEVLDRALLCDPTKRYQDATEMKAALQHVLHAQRT
jgi:serine/threonine protein kinase